MDAITAAYTSKGLECPLHIRGHSTRAIASSWAGSRGMSIQDICLAAGWSSQNTFARFYKLDVQSLASQVLSVSNWFKFLPLFLGVCLYSTTYVALYEIVIIVGPGFSAAYMVMLWYAVHTVNSVQPLILLLLNCSALLSVQLTLSFARYANLVYLWCRRSLAYLQLSAVSPPYECRYWWECCRAV